MVLLWSLEVEKARGFRVQGIRVQEWRVKP